MRELEKRKVIEKTNGISSNSFGEALYFRPYQVDDKTISEIARSTGEKKSAVAQKLVHIALSGKQVKFGENRTEEKLDWLIKNERHRAAKADVIDTRVDRIEEHSKQTEDLLMEIADTSRQTLILTTEVFCMTNVCVSYLNQIFTKLLEFLSPVELERTNSSTFANYNIQGLIEHSMTDLKALGEHYNGPLSDVLPEALYLFTKIEKIKERLATSALSVTEAIDGDEAR
ncbi:MAG: hypothetical protein WBD27_06935 [Pyrinomonadaceae bacterium]